MPWFRWSPRVAAATPTAPTSCPTGLRPDGNGANKYSLDQLSPIHDQMINLIKLAAFFALGQVSAANFAISASLFPIAIAATFGGVWLVRRVQAAAFYKIVYGLTFVLGLKLMFDGVRGLGWI